MYSPHLTIDASLSPGFVFLIIMVDRFRILFGNKCWFWEKISSARFINGFACRVCIFRDVREHVISF